MPGCRPASPARGAHVACGGARRIDPVRHAAGLRHPAQRAGARDCHRITRGRQTGCHRDPERRRGRHHGGRPCDYHGRPSDPRARARGGLARTAHRPAGAGDRRCDRSRRRDPGRDHDAKPAAGFRRGRHLEGGKIKGYLGECGDECDHPAQRRHPFGVCGDPCLAHAPRAHRLPRGRITATAAPVAMDEPPRLAWHNLVPRVSSWQASFYAMHEWIGTAWYALRA